MESLAQDLTTIATGYKEAMEASVTEIDETIRKKSSPRSTVVALGGLSPQIKASTNFLRLHSTGETA